MKIKDQPIGKIILKVVNHIIAEDNLDLGIQWVNGDFGFWGTFLESIDGSRKIMVSEKILSALHLIRTFAHELAHSKLDSYLVGLTENQVEHLSHKHDSHHQFVTENYEERISMGIKEYMRLHSLTVCDLYVGETAEERERNLDD